MANPLITERGVIHRQGGQLPARPDFLVARVAADQWGVVSFEHLRGLGLSEREIETRVNRGSLHPKHRGVYAVGHPNICFEGRCLAAVLACREGTLLSFFAAGALYGAVEWLERDIEVTVPGTWSADHDGIQAHRSATLHTHDVWRFKGVPITSPARTLVDLAGVLDEKSLRQVVRRMQALKLVNLRQIVETMRRLGPRRGSRKLAAVIATGPAPTRSVLEDVVLDLILDAGFDRPDVNVALDLHGRRVVPDFRWAEQKLIAEADSRRWHESDIARADDAERQALLEADGERVLRITWDQAIRHRAQTIARLDRAGAPRRAGPCPP